MKEDNKDVQAVDCTDELMNQVVEEEIDKMQIRSVEELKQVPYNELTEEEKQFLISALMVKNDELDNMINRTRENNRKVIEMFNKEINKIEEAFELVRETSRQNYIMTDLIIKNLEREVREHGN